MKTKLTSLTATFILMLVGLSPSYIWANNLQIGTPTQPAANQIQFTISWSNAWNNASGTPNNWDAAWVFVKQQDCTGSAPQPWTHVALTSVPGNNSVTGGSGNLQVDTAADGTGVFIRPMANAGSGLSVSGTVTLTFASTPANTNNYKVFGIEMVYVPQGSYTLGDGGSGNSQFWVSPNGFISMTSEAAIANANTTLGSSFNGAMVASYPKGVNAFYCMKYEITQHQWVDFLNTLSYSQQAAVMVTAPNITATNWAMGTGTTIGYSRNGIKVSVSGISAGNWPATYACDLGGATNASNSPNNTYNEAFDGQDIACNWMNCQDLMYYLAWAALRPMTDLEFEKACRGTIGQVLNEYPWGTASITAGQTYVGGTSNANTLLLNGIGELVFTPGSYTTPATTSGLCVIGSNSPSAIANNASGLSNSGPARVGATATATTTRLTAGATYWGILDMAGNVWERTVGTYSSAACNFTGNHGAGAFSIPASWPTNFTSNPNDWNVRGGSWTTNIGTAPLYCPASSRYNYGNSSFRDRTLDGGGRGVRTHQ